MIAPVDMPVKRGKLRRLSVAAALLTTGLVLTGCAQQMLGSDQDGTAPAGDDAQRPVAGEESTPDVSPKASSNLPGETGKSANGAVVDSVRMGGEGNENKIAVLFEDGSLSIGEPEKVLRGTGESMYLDAECTNLSESGNGVAVSCLNSLKEYDGSANVIRGVSPEGKVIGGTFTTDGEAVLGVADSDRVYFYDAEGQEENDVVVSRNNDEALLINTGPERDERVAVIDRAQTRISDMSVKDRDFNAALRIGQGVGEVADGRGDDGVIVASDHRQQQFQIFTMLDVVRLHQEAPTGPSPWAVNWDAERQLAWVSTTGDNKLTAFSIKTGAPLPVAQIDTIANVRSIIDTPEGDLLLIAEDGQWQKLTRDEISEAEKEGVAGSEDIGQRILGGQD
ncbi:hypothetical protein CUROG_04870 [Corynebacterium urogenitale]|uniref:Prolipoprotein LppL n=1 Tax=Corynebacterium urogenitale TaxID=2487892 RepID=A0A5J6Z5N5_9CORY|nr:hypothetical protein CUROG_04870 [Corynebacterium urogenitale]